MPCLSAMSASRAGFGSLCRADSSSMATQAYSALAEKSIVVGPAVPAVFEFRVVAGRAGPTKRPAQPALLNSFAVLDLDHVQAALFLDLPGPAAGAIVFAGLNGPRAWPAAD